MARNNLNYSDVISLTSESKWVWNAQGQLVEVPAGQPAWDHDPVTGESLGQRLEDEATNGHTNGKLNIAVTDYTITDPSDPFMPDAKVLTDDVGHPDDILHTDLRALYPFGTGGGTKQALRVIYVKEGMSRYVGLRTPGGPSGFTFDIEAAEFVAGSIIGVDVLAKKLSGGWWELSCIRPWGSASSNQYHFNFGNTLSGDYAITSQVGDQITLAYPSMFDTNNPTPGSIIPTDGSAVIRAADVVTIENVDTAEWFNPADFSVFLHAVYNEPESTILYSITSPGTNSATTVDCLRMRVNSSGDVAVTVFGNETINVSTPSNYWEQGGEYKIAFSAGNGKLILSINGQAWEASGSIPSVAYTRTNFGSRDSSATQRLFAHTVGRSKSKEDLNKETTL